MPNVKVKTIGNR